MRKPSLPLRLAVALLHEIASGQHAPSPRFLSRREIMRQWEVSSPSATGSLKLLVQWGILTPHDRSGHRLTPDFRRRALLRLDELRLEPLAGRPDWRNRARAILRDSTPFRAIAVVSLVGDPSPEGVNACVSAPAIPAVPLEVAIKLPAQAIFTLAREQGVSVDFYMHDGGEASAREIVRSIRRSGTQGLIILRRRFATSLAPLARPLIEAGLPVVAAFGDSEGIGITTVNFNNLALGHAAATRLIEAGHRRIVVALPRTEESPFYFRERLEGAILAAKESRVPGVEIIPLAASFRSPRSAARLRDVLLADGGARPTALFATTVEVLSVSVPLLRDTGLKIPDHLSVLVCSSTPHIPELAQKFDLLRLDFAKIGHHAFEALRALHEGRFTAKTAVAEALYEPHGTVRRIT